MTDNRKIDALVAEHVFDLEIVYRPEEHTYRDMFGGINDVPLYSTDIAAAFEVVEKLVAEGLGLVLEAEPSDYWVSIERKGHRRYQQAVRGATAPLALCLAALKLKGVKV